MAVHSSVCLYLQEPKTYEVVQDCLSHDWQILGAHLLVSQVGMQTCLVRCRKHNLQGHIALSALYLLLEAKSGSEVEGREQMTVYAYSLPLQKFHEALKPMFVFKQKICFGERETAYADCLMS